LGCRLPGRGWDAAAPAHRGSRVTSPAAPAQTPKTHGRKGETKRAIAPTVFGLYFLLLTLAATTRESRASPDVLMRAFACIHHYEGSWTDPGAPYYGGLQMDWNFMSAYGSDYLKAWGTADHWPPSVQIAVAIRAYLSGRGFNPWPTSARLCGLL
jgi:hypothetical protein